MRSRFLYALDREQNEIPVFKRGEKAIAGGVPGKTDHSGSLFGYWRMNQHFHAAVERGKDDHAVFVAGRNQLVLRMRGDAADDAAVIAAERNRRLAPRAAAEKGP